MPPVQLDAKPKYTEGVAAATAIVNYNASPNDPHRPTSMPIYQSSTFIQPSATEFQDYDYTRSGNPTRSALETLVAGMEGAHAAFAFTSGMSALANMTRLLKSGDEILCNADIYGGMYRLLTKVATRQVRNSPITKRLLQLVHANGVRMTRRLQLGNRLAVII